jgi:hypothetical protein
MITAMMKNQSLISACQQMLQSAEQLGFLLNSPQGARAVGGVNVAESYAQTLQQALDSSISTQQFLATADAVVYPSNKNSPKGLRIRTGRLRKKYNPIS